MSTKRLETVGLCETEGVNNGKIFNLIKKIFMALVSTALASTALVSLLLCLPRSRPTLACVPRSSASYSPESIDSASTALVSLSRIATTKTARVKMNKKIFLLLSHARVSHATALVSGERFIAQSRIGSGSTALASLGRLVSRMGRVVLPPNLINPLYFKIFCVYKSLILNCQTRDYIIHCFEIIGYPSEYMRSH